MKQATIELLTKINVYNTNDDNELLLIAFFGKLTENELYEMLNKKNEYKYILAKKYEYKFIQNEIHGDWSIFTDVFKIPLDEEFVETYFEINDIPELLNYRKLNLNTIKKAIHLYENDDWKKIGCNHNLTQNFIEEYIDNFDISDIIYYQKVNIEFLDKYSEKYNKFDWKCIPNNHILTEEFCKKYFDKLNQGYLFLRQKLSENFLNEYYNFTLNDYELMRNNFI